MNSIQSLAANTPQPNAIASKVIKIGLLEQLKDAIDNCTPLQTEIHTRGVDTLQATLAFDIECSFSISPIEEASEGVRLAVERIRQIALNTPELAQCKIPYMINKMTTYLLQSYVSRQIKESKTDEVRVGNLTSLLQLYDLYSSLSQETCSSSEPNPFILVPGEFVPDWYKESLNIN